MRQVAIIDWLRRRKEILLANRPFRPQARAAAQALMAAAARSHEVAAVILRRGRPDLARSSLPQVKAPTLLIVGGQDEPVFQMNRDAMKQMHAHVTLEIVPAATYLFEEPGTLEGVAALAGTGSLSI